jgi:phospholipid-binding lipoprotein MlaA
MTIYTRILFIVVLLVVESGCATAQEQPAANPDPFEGMNRAIFKFNDGVDKYMLAPVARGYQWALPGFARRGVSNFFANLYDLNGALNAALQGRFKHVAQNGGRFVVNSTVGMFGFVDVATEMGIAPYRTDFGHTLAIWGVQRGPYLMVPLFGPRTARSATGTAFDTVASLQWQINDNITRNWLFAVEIVDNRAALTAAEDLITGDRYIFIRDAYLQQREYFIKGGEVEDAFSDSVDEFDWEE